MGQGKGWTGNGKEGKEGTDGGRQSGRKKVLLSRVQERTRVGGRRSLAGEMDVVKEVRKG